MKFLNLFLVAVTLGATAARAEIPANFQRENLVAWCIVPFDAKKRGPAERVAMLEELGLRRIAYDWRKEHVAEFDEEFRLYREHGLELFAFWSVHEAAYPLFEKHDFTPQVWRTLRSPDGTTDKERIDQAASSMEELARDLGDRGLTLGLYNHGGWGGRPSSLVAVCEELHARGHENVGIVYNFHHAHFDREEFSAEFARMIPHLLCLNLNGMLDPEEFDVKKQQDKIRPVGSGEHEKEMLRIVLESDYTGPVGILAHRTDRDVEIVLRENLEGLDSLLSDLTGE